MKIIITIILVATISYIAGYKEANSEYIKYVDRKTDECIRTGNMYECFGKALNNWYWEKK